MLKLGGQLHTIADLDNAPIGTLIEEVYKGYPYERALKETKGWLLSYHGYTVTSEELIADIQRREGAYYEVIHIYDPYELYVPHEFNELCEPYEP